MAAMRNSQSCLMATAPEIVTGTETATATAITAAVCVLPEEASTSRTIISSSSISRRSNGNVLRRSLWIVIPTLLILILSVSVSVPISVSALTMITNVKNINSNSIWNTFNLPVPSFVAQSQLPKTCNKNQRLSFELLAFVLVAVRSHASDSYNSDNRRNFNANDNNTCNRRQNSNRRFKSNKILRWTLDANKNVDDYVIPVLDRNPPRKVCLMIEPTPFTHVSGYANRFKEMLHFLKQAGDDVDILTVDSKTPASKLPIQYEGYPIRHTQGFTFPLYNHISLTVDLPEMKGARIIERLKPDLIHVTSPGCLLFAALFYARVMKIPLVMSYHTHLPTYGKKYLGFIPGVEKICWDLLRMTHSGADLTLVTSPQMKDELVKNGIPHVEVWRKGIDTVRFHPRFQSESMRSRMTNGNPNDFTMIYVGRLGSEKRLKDLKPVIDQLEASGTNVRMSFVGNGPQRDELQKYFNSKNTVFLGQLHGDELSTAFASADAFVMPSDSETLGFVVLESMASGVPVIGCAAGGILDLIHDGIDGYLVQPGDTNGYVQKLELLASNVTLRKQIGIQARQEAERWGWEAATSYLRNVQYEKALINFHNRAFGGFGQPGTAGLWRLLRYRIQGFVRKVTERTNTIFSFCSSIKNKVNKFVRRVFGNRCHGTATTTAATTNIK